MKLLKIVTFYIGVNIIGLPKIMTHTIWKTKNKIQNTLTIKYKIYN